MARLQSTFYLGDLTLKSLNKPFIDLTKNSTKIAEVTKVTDT